MTMEADGMLSYWLPSYLTYHCRNQPWRSEGDEGEWAFKVGVAAVLTLLVESNSFSMCSSE